MSLALDFRHSFPTRDAHTAQWAGLKGKQNSELLKAAEVAGYDVLLKSDQGIPHQESPVGRRLSIIVVRSQTNQLEDLLPLVSQILQALRTIQPGRTVAIP
jgi:hypothetical protein